jgi:hypothetical protein
MNITTISPQQLRKAADIQEKIESLQNELGQLLGGVVSTPAQATEAPRKYKFSAAARAKMRACAWRIVIQALSAPSKPHFKCPETRVLGYASPHAAVSRPCDHSVRQLGTRPKMLPKADRAKLAQ